MNPVNLSLHMFTLEESSNYSVQNSEREVVGKHHQEIYKSKEAEDNVCERRPQLVRQASLIHFQGNKLLTKEQDMLSKTGKIWNCVDRKPNKLGGYVYTFKLKQEYNDWTPGEDLGLRRGALMNEIFKIFPALEPTAWTLARAIPPNEEVLIDARTMSLPQLKELSVEERRRTYTLTPFDNQKLEDAKNLKKLGYEFKIAVDGIYFDCPDREAFLSCYEKLREENSSLPPITIAQGKGIASNREFINKFFTDDVFFSEGEEFLHDGFSHLMSRANLILNNLINNEHLTVYQKERFRLVKLVAAQYRRIIIAAKEIEDGKLNISQEELSKIEGALSALTDIVTSVTDFSDSLEYTEARVEEYFSSLFWDDVYWSMYWMRQFGEVNKAVLNNVWQKIKEVEINFDETRKQKSG